jgi:hypothetical protein
MALYHPEMLHVTGAVPLSPFIHSHCNDVTDCVIRVIGRSVMGQILELRRGRHYGTVLVTNVNRTSGATNK